MLASSIHPSPLFSHHYHHINKLSTRAIIMTSSFQETCIQDDAQRILQRRYITPRKRIADRQPCSSFLSQSTPKEDGHDNLFSWLDSRNLSWLSPASTVSTASSLASADFLWDSPKTPSGPSNEASSRSILTPLTPPTTFGSSKKLLFTPIPQPSFVPSFALAAKQPLLEKKDVTLPDDPFFQPKLFRGFTFELEASTYTSFLNLDAQHLIYSSQSLRRASRVLA